jgi:hypothetical protein
MDKTIKDVSENDFFAALDNALEDADRKFVQPLKDGEFTAKTVSIRKNISIHHAEKLIEQMVKDKIAEKALLIPGNDRSALRRAPTGGQPMTAYRLIT